VIDILRLDQRSIHTMATPRQILAGRNQVPGEDVIAHEVGHTAVAHSQVLQLGKRLHCCIVFAHMGNGTGPIAQNPVDIFSPQELIMRDLAGIICQAIHCPASIEAGFRTKLLEGSLFASAKSIRRGSAEASGMGQHNALSDWANAIERSKKIVREPVRRVFALQTAQNELLRLMEAAWFNELCTDMISDVIRWLDEEQGDAVGLAIYPESRIAKVFARHPRQ
jgi:hypothetical protein